MRSALSCRAWSLGCAALLVLAPCSGAAQTFPLAPVEVADSAALAGSMPRLAAEVLAAYRDTNRVRYFDNAFRLQMLTGRYRDASASLAELRSARRSPPSRERALDAQYEVLVNARAMAARSGRPFRDTFADSFRETFARLDNATSAWALRAMLVSPRTVASDLRWATPDQTGKTTVPLEDALTLLHVYQAVEAYREFAGLLAPLVAEDDARRYVIEPDLRVVMPGGATVCAVVVRPRGAGAKRPALLQFTIYADSVASMREALLAAAHGYVGVTGHTRGKACSPDQPVPYRHDGADAAALIDWIAAQPWSDGRVGMYGGSYSGFTAWAATRQMPSALKGIMVGAPVAPGIDVPMEGNVFQNFVYPWPFYATNTRWLDNATYNDNRRWNRLSREWYRTGRAYRELEAIDGTANPRFAEWLAHPAVDEYWRAMIPQDGDYARITIPVLQTAGYFYGGPGGALHYFLEHYRHNPQAEHYLVIGPYDHFQAQRGVVTLVGDTATYFAGYEIDPVARIDIVADLRYQWFDYVLRGGPRPALLAGRVNYQVMGANTWRHAPSIAAMSNGRLRLYLHPARTGSRHAMSEDPRPRSAAITLAVNLADRSDLDVRRGGGILDTAIDTSNAVTWMSEPLPDPVEVSGLLSGRLELVANKKDFDFSITLYELAADGQYFQLPPYTSRASHTGSLTVRRLLTPGKTERLDFTSGIRMMSRRVSAGSRLVLVLSILKSSGQQINYGTGKDVSDESVEDAGTPLTIRWLPTSFIELPVRR